MHWTTDWHALLKQHAIDANAFITMRTSCNMCLIHGCINWWWLCIDQVQHYYVCLVHGCIAHTTFDAWSAVDCAFTCDLMLSLCDYCLLASLINIRCLKCCWCCCQSCINLPSDSHADLMHSMYAACLHSWCAFDAWNAADAVANQTSIYHLIPMLT